MGERAGRIGVTGSKVLAQERVTSLGGRVESSPLVPLHVPDASNRLDLRDQCPELCAVLVLPLLKQVLETSVSRILVPHPTGARGA